MHNSSCVDTQFLVFNTQFISTDIISRVAGPVPAIIVRSIKRWHVYTKQADLSSAGMYIQSRQHQTHVRAVGRPIAADRVIGVVPLTGVAAGIYPVVIKPTVQI